MAIVMTQEPTKIWKGSWLTRLIQQTTALLKEMQSTPGVRSALKRAGALEVRVLEMAQGQKKSRIVAWTFLEERVRNEWCRTRWRKKKNAEP